ncbi:MAG: hypothetical protein AB1726_06490 [Planctomycetota bacterium]
MRSISALMLALLPALLAALAAPPRGALVQDGAEPTALLRCRAWEERLARDSRLAFGTGAAERARAELAAEEGEGSPLRLAALIALGASGELGDVDRIEAELAAAEPAERRAAVLALGEMGEMGRGPLGRALTAPPVGLEEWLVLAWIHADPAAAAADAAAWAAAEDSPLAGAARLLADHARGAPPPEGSPAAEEWLELRWLAARRFGTVAGARWPDLLLAELLADEEFLDRVICSAAARRNDPAVRDHLLEILREGERPGALPGAVAAMPEVLGAAVQAGIWRPANLAEWRILLGEVEDRRIERRARALLESAMAIPELEPNAALQLLRAGGEIPKAWINRELATAPMERRVLILEATADRDEPERIHDLLPFVEPGQPISLQAAALVALARLQHRRSIDGLLQVLASGRTVERRELILSICRQLHDTRLERAVAEALEIPDLEPELRFRLEVERGVYGWLRDRTRVRRWLREGHAHPLRRDAVRALGTKGGLEDRQALRELFPVEDDFEVNVELALGLLEYREPVSLAILRAALWEGSWNQSVLAGGLLARAISIHGLIEELSSPPRGADDADLRRVGFAVGEWGGFAAAEALARRRTESDPAVQGAFLGVLATRTH